MCRAHTGAVSTAQRDMDLFSVWHGTPAAGTDAEGTGVIMPMKDASFDSPREVFRYRCLRCGALLPSEESLLWEGCSQCQPAEVANHPQTAPPRPERP